MNLVLSRLHRRLIVAAHYMSLLALAAAGGHIFGWYVSKWLTACFLLTFLGSGIGLLVWARRYKLDGLCTRNSAQLDERQSQVRMRTLAASYSVVSSMLIAFFVWLAVSRESRFVWRPKENDWINMFSIAVVIIAFVPSAIAVWNEPDWPVEMPGDAERGPASAVAGPVH